MTAGPSWPAVMSPCPASKAVSSASVFLANMPMKSRCHRGMAMRCSGILFHVPKSWAAALMGWKLSTPCALKKASSPTPKSTVGSLLLTLAWAAWCRARKTVSARPHQNARACMAITANRWWDWKPVDTGQALSSGAHLFFADDEITADNSRGYVTSVCYSPTLNSYLALGFLENGRARHGEKIHFKDHLRGIDTMVEVCDPVFLDPEGGRARGLNSFQKPPVTGCCRLKRATSLWWKSQLL